jgi:hypothetical protein
MPSPVRSCAAPTLAGFPLSRAISGPDTGVPYGGMQPLKPVLG